MSRRACFASLVVCGALACSSNESETESSVAHVAGGGGRAVVSSAGAAQGVAGAAASQGDGGALARAGSTSTAGTGTASGGSAGASGAHAGGAGGSKSAPIPVKDLPAIEELPDPLTMNDGTKVSTPEQWKNRRQEMIQILEDYEYGHMPPPPGNVKATVTTTTRRVSVTGGLSADYRMLHLTFGPGEKLGFDLGVFTPVSDGQAAQKYPVLLSLTSSTNDKSLGSASAAFSRGYAVATINYQQLGADAANWASTAFFSTYPDYDWRDISAWAWGLSRAVDYLVTDSAIDSSKIMITGVSRLAQAVLVAGAFDERIALSAPVAGGAAFRFSGKEMGGGRRTGHYGNRRSEYVLVWPALAGIQESNAEVAQ